VQSQDGRLYQRFQSKLGCSNPIILRWNQSPVLGSDGRCKMTSEHFLTDWSSQFSDLKDDRNTKHFNDEISYTTAR
jgi:hypothetical protein